MAPESILDGTVALVTGASSGIGEATAKRLAAEGAAVAVGARRLDRLEKLVAEIADAGGTAVALESDVTDRAQAEDLVERTVKTLGRLDTVVNNAGVMLLGPSLDAPIEEWERMVDLNVKGLLYVAKAALPHLVKFADEGPRKVTDMVNISSVAGRRARAGSAVYNATKFGVGAFSEALRQEVTERHLRISLVEPGAVETELSSHNRPEVLDEIKGRFLDLERMAASDIADSISYIVTRPRHVAINEILIRPTDQRD
jgi:NADP-dependent 3-hydroxy acid dehydrogenase YdfG